MLHLPSMLSLNLWMFLKLITGFAIIIFYLNISGRSQFSQMNAVDLVGNFILGGLVGGVLYTTNIPYHEYVIALCIGVGILLTITLSCRKINLFRNVTIGRQIPIIKDGHFLMDNIRNKSNKIDMLNVASQLNIQGIYSFDDVYYAQIEPNGTITAITDKRKLPALIVYYDGVIRDDDLKEANQTEDDLKADMARRNIAKLEDIYLAEFKEGQFRYVLMDGNVIPHTRKEREEKAALDAEIASRKQKAAEDQEREEEKKEQAQKDSSPAPAKAP